MSVAYTCVCLSTSVFSIPDAMTSAPGEVATVPDMPHGTDRPYPIRILAFFEMIRPYHVVIRISGNLWGENCKSCSKTKVLSSTQLHFPRLNFLTDMIDRRFHR